MASLEVLTAYRWPTDEFPLASLRVRVRTIAARASLPVQEWEEDGLGPAEGFGCRTQSGLVFLLREMQHAVQHFGLKGPNIHVDAGEFGTRSVDSMLEEILGALSLTRADVTWIQDPSAQEEAAKVVRQVIEYRERKRAAEEAKAMNNVVTPDASVLAGTWCAEALSERGCEYMHLTEDGRAIQFAVDPQRPDRRFKMRLLYAVESASTLRVRPKLSAEGWTVNYRFDGVGLKLLHPKGEVTWTRVPEADVPDWFRDALTAGLAPRRL